MHVSHYYFQGCLGFRRGAWCLLLVVLLGLNGFHALASASLSACDGIMTNEGVDYFYDMTMVTQLGPPQSPGQYLAGGLVSANQPSHGIEKVLMTRKMILEKSPKAWRWLGTNEVGRQRHTLPQSDLDSLARLYSSWISSIQFWGYSPSASIAYLKRLKPQIVHLASLYPEFYQALIRIITLHVEVPQAGHRQHPLLVTAAENLREMSEQSTASKVVSMDEFKFRKAAGRLDLAQLTFFGRKSSISFLSVGALLDSYLYAVARYTREPHAVEPKALISKRLVQAFSKSDWKPVLPADALIDLEFLLMYNNFLPLLRTLQREDAYAALIRRLALSSEARESFEHELYDIFSRHGLLNYRSETELYQNLAMIEDLEQLFKKIESTGPDLDVTMPQLQHIIHKSTVEFMEKM